MEECTTSEEKSLDLWSDDLNCRHHDLERALEDDNYDGWGYDRQGYFLQLQRKDESIQGCDDRVKYYQDEIKNLKDKIKRTKEKKKVSRPRGKR